MAEFGENIRKAREKLGITQQTLADRLYVTRQAVSRWENGSRYPDLLTAKRLSQELDATLDDLLSNDDMHTYPEVNPLIEYPLHKRVQTALFAASVVTNLIVLIWYLGFILTGSERDFISHWDKVSQFTGMLSTALITVVLIIGLVQSIKDKITPSVAARLAVMIIGVYMLNALAVDYCYYRNQTADTAYIYIILTVAYLLVYTAMILSILRFFCGKKPHSPIPVYIFSGIMIVYD
ncbi:MAG: helix-turn-helix transcriptional regulator, partial [Oscillospiraceae bacterium]|nr:helix-turn-helix transcriptional regulator [Oscillospiraceae bacterium]